MTATHRSGKRWKRRDKQSKTLGDLSELKHGSELKMASETIIRNDTVMKRGDWVVVEQEHSFTEANTYTKRTYATFELLRVYRASKEGRALMLVSHKQFVLNRSGKTHLGLSRYEMQHEVKQILLVKGKKRLLACMKLLDRNSSNTPVWESLQEAQKAIKEACK